MTRTAETYSTTPFARMLTAYMWSQTPPWTTTQLGNVLGVTRVRIGRWIYHDIVPELDTMLAIMARLGIPLSRLIDAYVEAGLPVPPLTEEAARQMNPSGPSGPSGLRERPPALWPNAEVVLPATRQGHPKQRTQDTQDTHDRQAALQYQESEQPEQPKKPQTDQPEPAPRKGAAQGASDEEWETMIAHTRRVMAEAGMEESAIEAMLKNLRTNKPIRRTSSAHQATQANPANQATRDNQINSRTPRDTEPRQSSKPR